MAVCEQSEKEVKGFKTWPLHVGHGRAIAFDAERYRHYPLCAGACYCVACAISVADGKWKCGVDGDACGESVRDGRAAMLVICK